ncbi:MAG: methyltransferase domain-containing protein [Lachnospiraceae bacterium]|nr:methyltransferase domain-containing protein [Lachnospiraceae bacterium]
MEAYTDFALVYDVFMDETPYEEWCDYIVELLDRYGSLTEEAVDGAITNAQIRENLTQERRTVLDLGCGTGTLTELLARRGYEMIGVDNAPEMLQIAMEKRERSGLNILYLLQDMREFELYGTVGAVISVCDSLNYLLEEEDILQTFRLVNNYLYPQGLFIFDFNTVYKYEVVIGDTTIAENREECSFIWENYYHEEEEINEYDLTIFVKEGVEPENARDAGGESERSVDGSWFRRFRETHYQRGYRLGQMLALVEQAGLQFIEAIDADTHGAVTDESERIYIVARKGEAAEANSRVCVE